MKLRHISALLAAGAASAAIALAPTAAAAPTGLTCVNVGATTTQCQSPGNVQINDSPGGVQFYPYGGDAFLLGGNGFVGGGGFHGGGFGGGHGGGHR